MADSFTPDAPVANDSFKPDSFTPDKFDKKIPGRPVGAGDVAGARQYLEQRYGPNTEPPGFWRSLYNTTIGGVKSLIAPPQLGESVVPNPFAVFTGANATLPIQRIATGAAQGAAQEGKKTVQELQAGHPVEATGHALATVLPVVGPAAAHAGESIASGNFAGGAGEATGLLLPSAISAFRGGIAHATEPLQDTLREGAVKQYTRALAPTTLKNKALAAKVVEGQPGIPGELPRPPLIPQELTADTPPPPPGTVRLYRGEHPTHHDPGVWQHSDPTNAMGGWFSSDKNYASYYQDTQGKGAQIVYMDVPKAIADKHSLPNFPQYSGFTESKVPGLAEQTFFFPDRTTIGGAALPGTPGMSGIPRTPGLIERGVTALTRKGLQTKIGGMVSDLGDQIDQLQSQIPVGAKSLPLDAVTGAIDKGLRDRFTIEVPPTTPGGQTLYVPSGPMAQAGLKVGAQLKNMLNIAADTDPVTGARTIDYQLLRRFRQNWDSAVADAGGFANKDFVNQAKMGAYKEATNGVRAQLNSATPDIAAINREFHFWKMGQDVIDATVERTAGQSQPLGQQLMKAGGVAGGLATGSIGKAVLTGEALGMFRKLTTSTGWNTMSAVFKDRLANALARGDVPAAKTLMRSGIVAAGANNQQRSLPAPPAH